MKKLQSRGGRLQFGANVACQGAQTPASNPSGTVQLKGEAPKAVTFSSLHATGPSLFTHYEDIMRQLTLNEKISIKGQLASKGVRPGMLVNLGMSEALRLYWACFGRPASTHSLPARWHKPVQRIATRTRVLN